jgi:pimeloyl-ACP methyl ester carboxylesterase
MTAITAMRVTTDDGVELAVEVAGDGPGLMLVHGFGGAKEDFADHRDRFALEHTVVTFDHRGHGASDAPDQPSAYSLERLRADTLEVADAVGLARFRLLGHSMGGMVVRRIAVDHAERVSALVMMDTSPGPIPGFDPELMDLAAGVALNEGKDALKALLDMAPPLDTPAYQRVLAERPGYQEFEARKWANLSAVMWGAIASALAHQSDDLDAMRSIDIPVLVIVGDQDKPFLTPSRAMADAIAGAQLAVIPNAGHSPQFENPDAWFAALNGFLASLDDETEKVA